ncbi:Esterase FE4 [Orchesella cincta]|uniref:Carboxylic ester hydrolase n=1 Tax=Orchesella cincta TaxID=48709 RepID=A0A1D2N9E7_ORCCI|nr:Esterase FE4 [Orchesella cincta]
MYILPLKWEAWNGIRDGRKANRDDRCIQISKATNNFLGSENPLFLNVFAPKFKMPDPDAVRGLPPIEPPVKYPVFVFIHGGGYNVGSGDLYGNKFLADEEVILVNFNYRLGVLGFLNTGEGTVPGNLGLKDQCAALRWIRENIKYFGGDSSNVVLCGESAGAACVHFHMMSPMSKGLFAKCIMQSGSGLSPWAFNRNPSEKVRKLAKQLDLNGHFNHTHMPELVRDLKRLDAQALVAQRKDYEMKEDAQMIHFAPSAESGPINGNTFLTDTPSQLLYTGKLVTEVPMILGINREEGLYRSVPILRDSIKLKALNEHWSHELPTHLMYKKENVHQHDDFSKAIRKFYFGSKPILGNKAEDRERLTNMISDRLFIYPTRRTALIHRSILKEQQNKIFLYCFSYKGYFSYMNGFEVSDTYGASHADELQYLFNQRIFYSKISPGSEADKMIDKMVALWSNFAKTGTPYYKRQFNPWLPMPSTTEENGVVQYFQIDTEDRMIPDPFQDRMEFWEHLPNTSLVF